MKALFATQETTCRSKNIVFIGLTGFFNGTKTVSRFRPLNDITIFGSIFGIYAEIFGCDIQGFTEIFGPLF